MNKLPSSEDHFQVSLRSRSVKILTMFNPFLMSIRQMLKGSYHGYTFKPKVLARAQSVFLTAIRWALFLNLTATLDAGPQRKILSHPARAHLCNQKLFMRRRHVCSLTRKIWKAWNCFSTWPNEQRSVHARYNNAWSMPWIVLSNMGPYVSLTKSSSALRKTKKEQSPSNTRPRSLKKI